MSEETDTVTLPGFSADTSVEPLGDGRFGAEMSERWWVGKGPNGGIVAATILRAIQAMALADGALPARPRRRTGRDRGHGRA